MLKRQPIKNEAKKVLFSDPLCDTLTGPRVPCPPLKNSLNFSKPPIKKPHIHFEYVANGLFGQSGLAYQREYVCVERSYNEFTFLTTCPLISRPCFTNQQKNTKSFLINTSILYVFRAKRSSFVIVLDHPN